MTRAFVAISLVVVLAGCESRERALSSIADARAEGAAALAPGPLSAAERALAKAEHAERIYRRDLYREARTLADRARVESERVSGALRRQQQSEIERRGQERRVARDALDEKRAALVPPDDAESSAHLPRISPTALLRRLHAGDAGMLLLDVRGDAAFAAGHVPTAAPTSLLALEHAQLPRALDLVLYGARGGSADVVAAARTLDERGYDRVSILDGGFERWSQEGQPQGGRAVGTHEPEAAVVRADELRAWLETEAAPRPLILDVRARALYEAGHVPGAVHVALGVLSRGELVVPKGSALVIYSADDASSRAAARAALASGHRLVHRLEGGTRAWAEHGLPLRRGSSAHRLALGGTP